MSEPGRVYASPEEIPDDEIDRDLCHALGDAPSDAFHPESQVRRYLGDWEEGQPLNYPDGVYHRQIFQVLCDWQVPRFTYWCRECDVLWLPGDAERHPVIPSPCWVCGRKTPGPFDPVELEERLELTRRRKR